ncbi:hypothetical protein BJX99DRAFT_261339 [Aspergillus californicus]
MGRNCSYSCSGPTADIQDDPDITGLGVIIGYIVSAGIVVIVLVVHYALAHQPMLDPFRDKYNMSHRAESFVPNPIDLIILRRAKARSATSTKWASLNAALTKCVLAMSDLQLATGIAILISGYAQLSCGLSPYHWLVISRLAWFSSLTHLSCLTFLRNYLHNRKAERQWRVLFMFVLVVMLITAMVPTAHYQNENYPAICYFSQTIPPPGYYYGYDTKRSDLSMITLVLSIGLGFIFRVIKLHPALSVFVVDKLRKKISRQLQKLLWTLRDLPGPMGDILYYPALALFLTMRLLADHFTSMFFEIYWLLISFLVGLFSFLLDGRFIFAASGANPPESGNWSFGQIMPILLLAVPLINILESFYPVEEQRPNGAIGPPPSEIPAFVSTDSSIPPPLDPDQDYYCHSSAMKAGSAFTLICESSLGSWIFISPLIQVGSTITYLVSLKLSWLFLLLALWGIILVSFAIDRVSCRGGKNARMYRRILQTASVILFTACCAVFIFFQITGEIDVGDSIPE